MATKDSGEFYQWMPVALTAMVIIGFGSAQLSGSSFGSMSSPVVIAHGLVFFAWYVLLIVQPRLIAAGNWQFHKTLGATSVALAVLMVVTGYLITLGGYRDPGFSIAGLDNIGSTIFPVTDLVNFLIVYCLALWHRKNGAAHKRLMLFAGFAMLDPAAARLILSIGAPEPAILLIHIGFLGAFYTHDFRTLGKPHWATVLATILFILAGFAKFVIGAGEWWAGTAGMLFG